MSLRAGPNPILVRYDQAGRGYFVVKRDADRFETAEPHAAGDDLVRRSVGDSIRRLRRDAACRMVPFHRAARFAGDDGHGTRDDRGMGGRSAHACRGTGPIRGGRSAAPRGRRRAACDARNRILRCGGVSRSDPVGMRTRPTPLGDWSQTGVLECYSGGAWYRKTITLTEEQAGARITLDLGDVVATAEVRVNGQLAGIRVAPPWRVDISEQVKAGENRIEVLVFNTLANHYLTIPTRYAVRPGPACWDRCD